jgi:hypothetical protein
VAVIEELMATRPEIPIAMKITIPVNPAAVVVMPILRRRECHPATEQQCRKSQRYRLSEFH